MQEFFAQGTSMGTSLGSSRAVAAFRGVVAVGTSSGISGVLMPRGLSTDGHPSGCLSAFACVSSQSKRHTVTTRASQGLCWLCNPDVKHMPDFECLFLAWLSICVCESWLMSKLHCDCWDAS